MKNERGTMIIPKDGSFRDIFYLAPFKGSNYFSESNQETVCEKPLEPQENKKTFCLGNPHQAPFWIPFFVLHSIVSNRLDSSNLQEIARTRRLLLQAREMCFPFDLLLFGGVKIVLKTTPGCCISANSNASL